VIVTPRSERCIIALVLPALLEELVLQRLVQAPETRASRALPSAIPRAVVLSEHPIAMIEPNARLDAVNAAARKLGVSTRQTIAQAIARAGQLVMHTLPPACVSQALQRVAEAALGFGTPVSFRAPDTVWVDVSGTKRLFGGERELALALAIHVRSLGHSVRVAGAAGPWLARAFARHADFDETGVFLLDTARTKQASGSLPIGALPISDESVAWFARLGLLCLDDLRKLPRAALAARLEEQGSEHVLDLIDGRDEGVLDAYLPEELPFEEQSWDFPLENVEPLLFVLKGLTSRLGARLEGRGQAAQELLLGIRYDKGIAALRHREACKGDTGSGAGGLEGSPPTAGIPSAPSEVLEIPFRLASPLAHAEDLERIVRSRLQHLREGESLFAPSCGMWLQVTAITEARQCQLSLGQQSLDDDGRLGSTLSTDPRTLAVLTAELCADIGEDAVGMLEAHDSHLLEKSSCFVPIHQLMAERREPESASASAFDRQPTRLVSPIEFKAPLREKEIVVLDRHAFVIEAIVFEERLEAVEWWASFPGSSPASAGVSRDYFRLWLRNISEPRSITAASSDAYRKRRRSEGLEVLVFLDRDDGKKYVQGLYD
jgi:protein ImuB